MFNDEPKSSARNKTNPGCSSLRSPNSRVEKEKFQLDDDRNSTENFSSETVVRRTNSFRWIIVFASFCVHFIADGVLFSFGILMHRIKEDLRIELHTAGIIASLLVSLPLFLAPITGALVNQVGCRILTIIGGFLCSFGLLFASFVGNFLSALVGIGVMCGVGLSCVYVPAVVIVAHYFDENRAIATAIAVGGTGLGNALVAQLIHHLNNSYSDWRETTRFLAFVLFLIVIFGSLFRPVEFAVERKTKTCDFTKDDERLPPSCMTSIEKLHRFIEEMEQQRAKRQKYQSVCSTTTSNAETVDLDLFDSYSADDIKQLEDELTEAINRKALMENIKRFPAMKTVSFNLRSTNQSTRRSLSHFLTLTREQQEKKLLQIYQQPINQKDIFYPGDVPMKNSPLARTSCPDLFQSYIFDASSVGFGESQQSSKEQQTHQRFVLYRKGLTFLRTVRRMLGLHLFHDYRYAIFFLSQFLFYMFYDLIYLFPVDYGEQVIGYTKRQMTNLLTALGFGQFFGQLLFGLLANYTPIDELILYDVGAFLCGIASFLIPLVAHSYIALVLSIILFGLSISANYALTSVILANMCGLDLLTSAYGLILLGQGLSSLFGPIIGGWIAEVYGYQTSLIIAGLFMSASGCVTLLIPIIRWFGFDDNSTEQSDKSMVECVQQA